MNPFLFWFYQLLKLIVRIGERIYYPKVTVINKEQLKIKGPAIVVTNHPNTILDPFNAASRIWQPLHFLANASLFKSKIGNWFFSTFYCIPIKRKEDVGSKISNNQASFEKCDEFLSANGILFIAPEGGSYEGRQLEKIKTGTARIAFSAEAKNNFQLGLQILPIGLIYESPGKFRSSIIINVGQAFKVQDLKTSYERGKFETAKDLTEVIKNKLDQLIINPISPQEDSFLAKAESLYLSGDKNSDQKRLSWVQNLATKSRSFPPDKSNQLYQATEKYFGAIESIKTNDQAVYNAIQGKSHTFLSTIFLILGLPIFLYGFLNHLILLGSMHFTWKKLQLYSTYEATVKFMILLIVFPLSYYLQSELVERLSNTNWSWWYLLSLIPTGIFASRYWKVYLQWIKNNSWNTWSKKEPQKARLIIKDRQHLWQQLRSISSS